MTTNPADADDDAEGRPASRRRSRADVVDAALRLLDDEGLDAVTLREVARRLGAHLNTVSFQVKTKARLFELMADAILGGLSLDGLPAEPLDRVRAVFRRYRAALLAHRDGARLVAGTTAIERNTLTIGEAIVAALLAAGIDETPAVRAFWGLHYFLIGLVQEEQDVRPAAWETLRDEVRAGGYPALAVVDEAQREDSFEARLEFGMDAFLRHAADPA